MASTTLTTLLPKHTATSTATGASTMAPQTPVSKLPANTAHAAMQTPSPGNWRHPRMAEIVRRRKASLFDASNILRIVSNVAALLASFIAAPVLKQYLPFVLTTIHHTTAFLGAYQALPLHLLRILFLYNVYQAIRPSWLVADDLSDIPLTPLQRRLLGLDPGSGKANTPKTEYVTPPKYNRLTPRSQSPAWTQGRRDGDPAMQRDGSSPAGSPLWAQTAKRNSSRDIKGDGSISVRRNSFTYDGIGSANISPSRDTLRESSGSWIPSTPTPSNRGTNASVGLNSKWLYERGRSSSGSRRSFGGL